MIEFPDSGWKDYELLDSGAGEKLERFGAYVLARPEPKALWDKSLPQGEWDRLAHTRFRPGAGFGKAGKEDSGTWDRLRRMDDQWWIKYKDISLRLGLTSFKHVGVFPEQAPNWDFIYRKCREMERPRVLNLFAYTGAASLAARAGGAEVTHLDSVRQVVTWARGNMERTDAAAAVSMSGGFGGNAPRPLGVQGDSSRLRPSGVHWVVEDAMKFARREARRGNVYDGIILDPPAYGHGPDGEKWKLDECLFEMLRTVAQILAPHGFVVLNLYSNGYSAALGETLVREAFGVPAAEGVLSPDFASLIPPTGTHCPSESELSSVQRVPAGPSRSRGHGRPRPGDSTPSAAGVITSGELALRDGFGKVLPLSIVVRLEK